MSNAPRHLGCHRPNILLVWSRLILPNGKSQVLDRLSAADAGGYAGLQDKVDYHWAGILNTTAISTPLGIGAQSGDPESAIFGHAL